MSTANERLREPVSATPAAFDPDTLTDLPDPAQRFLSRALPSGVPLATVVDVDATGEIKLGSSWWRFRSTQVLRAGDGFVWEPVVRRGPMRVTGADTYVDGAGTMSFKLFGLIPVARAKGPDTARSAAGRLAAETVAWLPQATTPQAGAAWRPVDDDRATVTLSTPTGSVDVTISVDGDGRLASMSMSRWNDSSTPAGQRLFGGEAETEFTTADDVRIMGSGRIGWDWGTPGWEDGEFFRFDVVTARHR